MDIHMKNNLIFDWEKYYTNDYKNMLIAWFTSEELQKLVHSFGGIIPIEQSTDIVLQWLLSFSEVWDYRGKQSKAIDSKTGEKARWMISQENLTEEQKLCIEQVADALGLRKVQIPQLEQYDYIIALGGARMSCLYRTKYAYHLARQYLKNTGELFLLSSMRKIADSEREATDTYAPHAVTEYDLMNRAIEEDIGLIYEESECCHEDSNPNKSWCIKNMVDEILGIHIESLAAPSSDENRRANSADTYQFFMECIKKRENLSVLLVTSQIYVPYQHIEAVRMLGLKYRMNIDTVGFPTEWNSNNIQGMLQYENYLQEIRSALQAIDRIWKLL